jgi:hypothetical protein
MARRIGVLQAIQPPIFEAGGGLDIGDVGGAAAIVRRESATPTALCLAKLFSIFGQRRLHPRLTDLVDRV